MTAPLTFPLALTPAGREVRSPAAFVVPGADPAGWLEGLADLAAGLGVSAGAFDLWALPGGAGLVALPAAPPAHAPPGRALAYGRLGERLLLPVDGTLTPDVTAAEVDRLLAPGRHLLHPVAGLVRLAEDARLGLADLVVTPRQVARPWRTDLEPPTAPLRLVSVEVQDPPPLEAFLRDGAGDVGSAPPSEAPPAPGEQQGSGWLGQQAARLVQWAAGKPQEDAPRGDGLLDRLVRWSDDTLAQVKDARQRELERLLHLLDRDPDEGLRYALPLRGEPGGGPPARPGASLPPRDVDYKGGARPRGPGDAWELDPRTHLALVARYRELAGRELRLGRYRRAAYVYAELLGDLASAASALEQGRHHREAAALYRDRLARPLEAARCLERGGLLQEAAALYEAQGRWVEAGDAWSRLERGADAERAYGLAVAARLAQDDPLSAARLLETKLDRVDDALEVLADTWPGHAQAGLCLEDRLALLGRHARHDDARRLLARLRDDPRAGRHALVLARALGASAARYPEHGVQARARDLARVVAGERLAGGAGPDETEALLHALSRLDPTDRLLARDVGRFGAQARRDAARARAPARRLARGGWGPVVRAELRSWVPVGATVHVAEVAAGVLWTMLLQGRHRVHCAWTPLVDRSDQPEGGRCRWDGRAPLLLVPPWAADARALVSAGHERLTLTTVSGPVEVGTPGWLPDRLYALASNEQGIVWALFEDAASRGLVLGAYDAATGGRLLGTCAVLDGAPPGARVEEDDAVDDAPLLRAGRDARAVLAIGRQLLRFSGTHPVARWGLDRPARDLALLHQPFAAAVSLDDGGRVFFDDDAPPRRFGEGLDAPRLTFTPDGLLVALTSTEGRVYEVGAGTVEHRGTFDGPGGDLLCVRPTGAPREVVAVRTDGAAQVLAITRAG
ncbi:MAG: hypothetical protein M9894_05235 [Planctomycetes bacterium]|nr:hypothetical protein [Planctomycetota bacterium]